MVDLNYDEEAYPDGEVADIPVALVPRTGEITLLQCDGFLEQKDLWSEEQESELLTAVEAELQAAVEEAEKVGPPALSTMFDDVFAERTPALEEQWQLLRDAYEKGVLNATQHGEFPL